jgi:hypothetical protein
MYFSSWLCKGWKWFKLNFVHFSIENNGGGIIKRNSRHCKKMETRGGQEQLLLFLMGPSGSGISTAMTVAKQFFCEFCVAAGVMRSDATFLFTAYTGSAASLIGGVITSKAAYLNLQRQLSKDNIHEWKDVRIIVIDEVSFMSNSILKKLNSQLTQIGNRTKLFG